MTLSVSSTTVNSKHWLRFPAPQAGTDMEYFVFSGIAIFSESIKGTGSSWERGKAKIEAPYPQVIEPGNAIQPSHWTVDVHLASVSNRNEALNTGWAVDNFSLLRHDNNLGGGKIAVINGRLAIEAEIAVRDSDAFIHRLSYHVTILGKVVPFAPIID